MSKNTVTLMVLFAVIILSISLLTISVQAAPLGVAVKRQEFRNAYIKIETIIDALGVTKGMTILDIGSGPGYASFLFAEKLNGSGSVFATDIREHFVQNIADEAKKRGLTNLFSVLVKAEGLDEFYGMHRYDIVFASYVYHRIENPIEYFAELRKFLKPGARLVVVLYNQSPLFSVEDLTDLDGLINILSATAADNPYESFIQQLSPGTKKLLQGKTDREVIANALVDDFNRMLMNPEFYLGLPELFRSSPETGRSNLRMDILPVYARDFANWLLMTLNEDGVLEKTADQIEDKEMRLVIKLNRLFFQQQLGDYLANNGMGAYIPGGDASRHTNKYELLRELHAAGYEFGDTIKTSPYFDTIIMTPSVP